MTDDSGADTDRIRRDFNIDKITDTFCFHKIHIQINFRTFYSYINKILVAFIFLGHSVRENVKDWYYLYKVFSSCFLRGKRNK